MYLLSQSLLSCIKRTRDAQGRSNVLRPLQRRFKARKKPEGYTSTPTGLKRLKTQNTAFHVNANGKGTPSGVPQPIHKRKLILVKEEFDASSFGGDDGSRTRVRKHFHRIFSERSFCFIISLLASPKSRLYDQLSRYSLTIPGTLARFSCIIDARHPAYR